MRLADGSFRYWYASRKQPPFLNLYFAINTARWPGPVANLSSAPTRPLPLPPTNGDVGLLVSDERLGRSIDVLEVIDEDEAIVRAWYRPVLAPGDPPANEDATFVDLWVEGIDTVNLAQNSPAHLPQVFRAAGNRVFDTTCGKRSLPLLAPLDLHPKNDE
jgi:hypothetical protein